MFCKALRELQCAPVVTHVLINQPCAADSESSSRVRHIELDSSPIELKRPTGRPQLQLLSSPQIPIAAPLLSTPPTVGKLQLHVSHTLGHKQGI